MTRSAAQYQSKQQAIADFRNIAWEVLADGTYEYTCFIPEGQLVRTYEVKNGIATLIS